MSEKIRRKIYKHWWAYLLIAFAAAWFWTAAFARTQAVPRSAQLRIGYVGECSKPECLEDALQEVLSSQGIREVLVDAVNYEDDTLQAQAVWARSQDADIVLFAQEWMFPEMGGRYFASLPESLSGDYVENGTVYGIYLKTGECLFLTVSGIHRPEVRAAAQWLRENRNALETKNSKN